MLKRSLRCIVSTFRKLGISKSKRQVKWNSVKKCVSTVSIEKLNVFNWHKHWLAFTPLALAGLIMLKLSFWFCKTAMWIKCISNQIRTAKTIYFLSISTISLKTTLWYRLAEIHRAEHIMDGLNGPAEVLLYKWGLAQMELLLTSV